jgi:dTDP-4-dehydrorhamnose 3,5-epimerase-like enzyme
VLVDIRPESPTFSQSETFLLGPEHSYGALFISNGIANSLCVPEKKLIIFI